MKVGHGCHPFEMMPAAPVAARLRSVGAPFATAGDGRGEPPGACGTVGGGSVSCAECQCTLALTEDGTLTSCPGCGGRRFLSVSMLAATGELIATHASEIEVLSGGAAMLASAHELRAARAGLAKAGDYLLYREGGRLRTLALTRATTRVGRSLVADLRFEDPTVSRRHALIMREVTGMRLLDDRSLYGVFVNGERVESRMLHDGDVIALGRNRLLYQHVPSPAPRRRSRRPGAALPTAPRPRVR